MIGAYGWAFVKPIRKLYYNLTITFVSVVVALLVGGVEAIGLLKDQLNLTGGVWDFIGSLNDNFGTLGFVIIGVFIFSWIGSMIVYRVKGFSTVCHRRHRLPINALSRNREASKSLLCFCSSTSVWAVHLLTAASTVSVLLTPSGGSRWFLVNWVHATGKRSWW